MTRPLLMMFIGGTIVIVEFGSVVYGDAIVKNVPLDLLILCGGLIVMLGTVLGLAWLWSR